MVTSALLYHLLNFLHITVDVRNVCVFLAPLFSSFTTLVTYLITKELKGEGAGLVAAVMIAVVPGYISRSVAGSYDNEGIAIFCMLLTYYAWIRAVKSGTILWSVLAAVAYFYMVSSWGGYVFLINIIPLHVLVLMLTGRFSHRIYVAYSTLYVIGTVLSMQISFVGFQPVQTSEHMGALGVFGLCQLHAFVDYVRARLQGPLRRAVPRRPQHRGRGGHAGAAHPVRDGQDRAVDRPLLLAARPLLRQEQHPHQ